MNRPEKYLRLLAGPAWWPALKRRIAPTVEHGEALGGLAFSAIIDVGANKGQFAYFAHRMWPKTQLYCFEPLPAPRRRLAALMAGAPCTIFDCALGAERRMQEIRIASREDSSSLLPVGDNQTALFNVVERGVQQIEVRRLDEVLGGQLAHGALLKIDVQGFELEVLRGAEGILPRIGAIYVEASYIELYAGQALVGEVIAFLGTRGFALSGVYNQVTARGRGGVQADFLFKRT